MKKGLVVSGVLILLLACSGYALQNSVSFQPLDDNDVMASILGDYKVPYTGHFFLSAELSIPEDIKLVTSENRVVGNELCLGDSFTLQNNVVDGEYWDGGGYVDSPQIYWIKDVTSAARSLMGCGGENPADPGAFGGPVNQAKIGLGLLCAKSGTAVDDYIADAKIRPISGGVACSLREKPVDSPGLAQIGSYYQVTGREPFIFDASYDVECFYYYVSPKTGNVAVAKPVTYSSCRGVSGFSGTPAPVASFSTDEGKKAACSQITPDAFKVGEIKLTKTINVVDPSDSSVDMKVLGSGNLVYGNPTTLKVLVQNTGSSAITVEDVTSKTSVNRLISCDVKIVEPGKNAECLLSITPRPGEGSSMQLDYSYLSCGTVKTSSIQKTLIDSVKIQSESLVQVYAMEVHGGCENSYYACNTLNEDSRLMAGYKCYKTPNGFYAPSTERFDLKYDLSSMPKGRTIIGAKLHLTASKTVREISLRVYGVSVDEWAPAKCAPGGDICTQPYCAECARLNDLPATLLTEQRMRSVGDYALDVTDYVKNGYATGRMHQSFQVRGTEGLWEKDGASSCGKENAWAQQDSSFYAGGALAPYLEVAYK